jgi:hypothetical protein
MARLRRGNDEVTVWLPPVGLVPRHAEADIVAIYTGCSGDGMEAVWRQSGGGMGAVRGSDLKSLRLSHLWCMESGIAVFGAAGDIASAAARLTGVSPYPPP